MFPDLSRRRVVLERNRWNALSVTEQLSSRFTSSTAEVSIRCAP